jgi:hypothetical protein
VHSKNLVPGSPRESFRFHFEGDAEGDDRVVFIVKSSKVHFGTVPSNATLTRNAVMPQGGLERPQGTGEKTSTLYELQLPLLCSWCQSIANEYFDVFANPDKVALRMDLTGGREAVRPILKLDEIWHTEGSTIKQPLAQEVVFEYDVPGNEQQLVLSEIDFVGDTPRATTIGLQAPDGKPVEVVVGNAPLLSILRLDKDFKGEHSDDHFALFYDMFTPSPHTRPVLHLVPGGQDVSGPKDNCIPPRVGAQDPTP